MTVIYQTTITHIGACATMALEEQMLITFREGAPADIEEYCFKSDPSIKSSLKFLRRTPWARKEVEAMYLASLDDDAPVEKADPWANWQKK